MIGMLVLCEKYVNKKIKSTIHILYTYPCNIPK